MKLESSAFPHNGNIPTQFTCDGDDVPPPLAWSDIPQGTRSLALIVDDPDAPDPDAPKTVWVHWVLYNLPPELPGLTDATETSGGAEGMQGLNDWQQPGYGGPCPPIGKHRYVFKLFALDVRLPDLGLPTKGQLEQSMKGHVLDRAELIGLYQRH